MGVLTLIAIGFLTGVVGAMFLGAVGLAWWSIWLVMSALAILVLIAFGDRL